MNREGQGQKLDELVARSRRLRQEGITKEVIEPGARKARVARKVGV
jgi:transposase-like protein